MRVVKAEVLTSSSDDDLCRVKLKSAGLWDESPLIQSVAGVPLIKGNLVYVDITQPESPLILGPASDKKTTHVTNLKGSVLFESKRDNNWVIAYVDGNKLNIADSGGVSIEINNGRVKIEANSVEFNGGSNGGIVNVSAVKGILKAASAATPASTEPGFLAFKTSLSSILDVEDKRVKH